MPSILESSIGSGIRYTVFGSAAVLGNAEIVSTNSLGADPVFATIFGHSTDPNILNQVVNLQIHGTVIGQNDAIHIDDTIRWSTIFVARTGVVVGSAAFQIDQGFQHEDTTLVNHGELFGDHTGIIYRASTEDTHPNVLAITNRGSITGLDFSIQLDGGHLRLMNTGDILGDIAAVHGIDHITNTGTISGVVRLWDGDDRILNRGAIYGTVDLGSGNDLYDGRQGFVAELPRTNSFPQVPWVYGGLGDDTFINSAFADNFNGGLGIDTLRFDSAGAAIVFLGRDDGAGAALGDSYVNIENVVGSIGAADIITGNSFANTLHGRGGNDQLHGMVGNDWLVGGLGIDTLSGGPGNDVFVFANAAEYGDKITDFSNVAGNDDVIRISASGLNVVLPKGQLWARYFCSGTSNLAQDADDRFVFRTTDKTLWLDQDGKGGAVPVLIADLQDNAVFTHNDIFIY